MYEIKLNAVYRDGEFLCEIDRAGFLNWRDADSQRYVSPVVKFLQEENRYDRETGMAVWIMPGEPEATAPDEPEEPEKTEETTAVAVIASGVVPEDGPEICSVDEIVRIVEKMTGETAPPQSAFYGDRTPEVVAYLNRHSSSVAEVRRIFKFVGKIAERKDF